MKIGDFIGQAGCKVRTEATLLDDAVEPIRLIEAPHDHDPIEQRRPRDVFAEQVSGPNGPKRSAVSELCASDSETTCAGRGYQQQPDSKGNDETFCSREMRFLEKRLSVTSVNAIILDVSVRFKAT